MGSMDPFGNACLAYLNGIKGLEIIVHSDHADDDVLPVDYLFRSFKEMPSIEQMALQMCKGSILDIGAGAGCHSKWLHSNNNNVLALEKSIGAFNSLKKQNIPSICQDFFALPQDKKFDTLLILMNGTGIAGNMENFPYFLEKCKKHLNNNGQILIDSSDIIYLFEEEDGSATIPANHYYGEVSYQMEFNNETSEWFDWLYLDFASLEKHAIESGFNCKLIIEGEHYNYLAQLVIAN